MIMGSQLLHLSTSSRASRMRRLTAYFPMSVRRYGQANKEDHGHRIAEEKAPSTAEEFKRVAEEKATQGVASQTVDKAIEASEEVIRGDSSSETVENRYKEPPGRGNFHKRGDEEPT